ncbi:MAG TPA: ABC transporter substrate-binding protein, partial [Thermodesulfobacteriota bacterium]|nr:ABC transporter substrate-binding protein [Thermodesulfobacteriota bacterium]
MKRGFRWTTVICILVLFTALMTSQAPAAEKIQYGGTLRFMDMSPQLNPLSWDNADWVWKHGHDTGFVTEHMFMGDLQKGPRGTNEYSFHASAWIPPEVMRGELVERWEVSKNPMKIVFHLRKGVRWQEKAGVMKAREFTAEDVVYSMTRLKNARKAIPLYMDFIDRWEVVDKHTVVMHMKEWCAEWSYRMGWGYYDAVQAQEQEKAPGGANKWQNLCGTGPYMLSDYKEGHSETYSRNKDYWDSETIGGQKYKLPFADKIIMMIIKDEATRLAALRTGKVDLMMNVNWKHVAELKKSHPQLQWSRKIYTNGFVMALRMDTPPLTDKRVRQALNMAVNKQEIVDSLYGGNGEILNYPFPKTFTSVYTPVDKLPPSARELFVYNPEKAKKLLAEAGFPDGFTLKAQINNTNQEELDMAAMVAAYLAKVGVKLELETMDYPSWLSKMTKQVHSPAFFMASDHGNPFSCIRKNFVSGQTWNPYMMKDEYLDKTWKAAIENPNLTEKEAFEEMRKLAVYAIDQAPAVWLPGPYVYSAWWPWVKNYHGEIRVGAWRSA